jgi:hypothetical protein
MKRLLLFIPIVVLLLLPMGCGAVQGIIDRMATDMLEKVGAKFTIKVDGTTGLNFTGECEVVYLHFDPDGQSIGYTKDSYTVEGQVPQEYTFDGDATSVMFQKRADDWWTLLSVEVWQDEQLVASRETTDPWGPVWLTGGMLYG